MEAVYEPVEKSVTTASELEKLGRWHALHPHIMEMFRQQVLNEFLDRDELNVRHWARMHAVLKYAAQRVPFYQQHFQEHGIDVGSAGGFGILQEMPVIVRRVIQDQKPLFYTAALPPGQGRCIAVRSSGSTGEPVEIVSTMVNNRWYSILGCRKYRWLDVDMSGKLAHILPEKDLYGKPKDRPLRPRETTRLRRWPGTGAFFRTGPFVGFDRSNSLDDQIAWLQEQKPDQIMGQSSDMEHLSLAVKSEHGLGSPEVIHLISQVATPEMRRRIEKSFATRVCMNYGLNEIGMVALRCREGGRYHVHWEHCHLEIVDEQDRPVSPGEWGRILVTALNNLAMPLIRYDTGDWAQALEGPCPCGRTMPAFGEIRGRYRRIINAPEASLPYWAAWNQALETMSEDLIGPLRQYQLHLYADMRFELRLVVAEPMTPEFEVDLQKRWAAASDAETLPLVIRYMDEIPRPPGGKFQNFTSDFNQAPGDGDRADRMGESFDNTR